MAAQLLLGLGKNAHVQQRGNPVLALCVDREARQLEVTGGWEGGPSYSEKYLYIYSGVHQKRKFPIN